MPNLSPTDSGTIADDLDALVDAIALIEDAAGSATHIIANPQAWADLSKFKQATDSNVSLVGAGTTAPTRTLLSVPVLVSNSMTDGTLGKGDRIPGVSPTARSTITTNGHTSEIPLSDGPFR